MEKSFMDRKMFKNDYPIVLIHGYCGSTLDENPFLGGYFHYAFSKEARYIDGSDYISNIYEADVSPIGSAHDRACELFQQLIGINRVSTFSEKSDIPMSECVYGKEHVRDHHKSSFYK
jgi:hypothetical protein